MKKGLFIVVDGNEACGKTSAINILDKYIKGKNHPCVSTRAIGHGVLGNMLREQLLLEDPNRNPIQEVMICLTAVTDAINNFVLPNVMKGNNVILDRYFTSTLVYQAAEKFGLNQIDRFCFTDICDIINSVASNLRRPDVMILVHSDLENTKKRIAARQSLNRLDVMSDAIFNGRNKSFIRSFASLKGFSDLHLVENNNSDEEFEKKLTTIINHHI